MNRVITIAMIVGALCLTMNYGLDYAIRFNQPTWEYHHTGNILGSVAAVVTFLLFSLLMSRSGSR